MLTKARVGIILLGMALLLGASTGAAMGMGVFNTDEKAGATSMNEDELREAKQQVESKAEYGYISVGGRTGRIVSLDVEAKTFDVDSPAGGFEVQYTDSTIVQKRTPSGTETLRLLDLADGVLVIVTRTEGELDGRDNATIVEVVPEGGDGFTITDSSGSGPQTMPVFP
ncbi:MAG: hypothetical protein F4X65_05420 [Chloroflexi bacterium]|nr:hypothetical protein [Chloroflexota bacterium]